MKKLCLLLALCASIIACAQPIEFESAIEGVEPCRLENGTEALCGSITVPENRTQPNGRNLDIHFALLEATTNARTEDPVFFIAGGPGQATISSFTNALPLFDDVRTQRDIVLVDQRGTGLSNRLGCPQVENNTNYTIEDEESRQLIQQCAELLSQRNDLTQYTTDIAMQDLDAVREHLGYEQINLYGVSYGTRAAQVYMNMYPERVRTAVLDAVVSPELILFLQAPRDGQEALDRLFERCRLLVACRETFPDLAQQYQTLLEQVAQPRIVQLTHPISGEQIDVRISRETLSQQIYNILYVPDLASILPLLINNAVETGDVTPIVSQALLAPQGTQLTIGLLYSVACTEDAPLIDMENAEQLQQGTLFNLMAEDFSEVCANWPSKPMNPIIRQPVTADTPVLLLSGSADPITPPRYADQVAATLPNSLHIVAQDFGHGLINIQCIPDLMAQFFAEASTAALQTSCVQETLPPPFFVNFAGPQP